MHTPTHTRITKSVFIETFGENPFIKVLDFLLMYPNFDYSKTQAADEAGISRITIEKIWSKLIKNNIIVKTREIGRAELYRLNAENPRVKILMKLDMQLASACLEEEADNKIAVRA